MSRSVGLAHIIRQADGTSVGVWGVCTLKSAFQPLFAFRGGRLRVAAFEGLLRPFRDDGAFSPGAFFASVPEPDRFHVETLSRTLHLLNAGACLDPAKDIFVNFDPSLFADAGIAESALRDMRLVLHEANVEPARVVCEVTEQTSTSQAGLKSFVAALRAHGYRIAVDDYGADDSDMERIGELAPDIVKFDAHWIGHLMETEPGIAILSAMVSAFRDSGIVVVFEGIEETWQLELAERCGASLVQGFAIARPEIAPTGFDVFRDAETEIASAATSFANAPPAALSMRAEPVRGRRAARAFGRRAG